MPETYRLNDYVLNGTGDPAKLLKGMYFWTWDTQEVLAMIAWMRACVSDLSSSFMSFSRMTFGSPLGVS